MYVFEFYLLIYHHLTYQKKIKTYKVAYTTVTKLTTGIENLSINYASVWSRDGKEEKN